MINKIFFLLLLTVSTQGCSSVIQSNAEDLSRILDIKTISVDAISSLSKLEIKRNTEKVMKEIKTSL